MEFPSKIFDNNINIGPEKSASHATKVKGFNSLLKGFTKTWPNAQIPDPNIVRKIPKNLGNNEGMRGEPRYNRTFSYGGQFHLDWPGLKNSELFQGRDLNSTIDARSVYASAMSTVFDIDFKRIKDEVWKSKDST